MVLDSKKRNILLIFVCFLIYFSTYILKFSYNSNIISIEAQYHVSHVETGFATSLFFISYGGGQFINGLLVKKYNIKLVMPIVVFLSCIINFLILFVPSNMFFLFYIYWFLNGAVLSLVWPCLIRFFVEHVSDEYKDKGIFILGMECGFGTGVTYALSSMFTALNCYILIYITGIAVGLISIFLWFFFFNKMTNHGEEVNHEDETKTERTEIKTHFVIYLILCIFLCIVTTFIRDGVHVWAPSILNESFNINESISVLITVLLPIAQCLGVVLSSLVKKYIKSHILLSILFLLVACIVLGIGWLTHFSNKIMFVVIMTIAIIAVSGPIHILCDVLPIAWSKERNSGLFAGIFNGCCFAGSAIASITLSEVADTVSWNMVFIVITLVAIGSLLMCALYYLIRDIYFRVTKTRF